MATFDELSARIAADTADFRSGMSGAERSLSSFERISLQAAASADIAGESIDDLATEAFQTAGAMQALSGRADAAGDQLSQTAVQAGSASAGLSSVSTSGTVASGSMLNFSTVLVASVAPALVTVAAAAVPVVAALGGLITVAGAILGVGLVGAIGAIATRSEQLKEQFDGLVQTIRTELAPVFELGAAVLSIWMSEFEDIIPALVPAESMISEIASLFEQFGTAIIETIPAFADLAVTLTRQFLPGMIRLAQDVLPRVPGFLRTLVTSFERLIPSFRRAGQLLVRLGPQLLEFGFAALSVVGPALDRLTTGITNALRVFNNLDASIQSVGLQVATVAPIIAGLASLLGGPITLAIAALVTGVIALGRAWQTNFAGIRDVVRSFGNQIQTVIPAAREAFNTFIQALNLGAITDSLQRFEQILGTQLRQSVEALQPVFGDLQTLLNNNREEFEIIGGAISGVVQALIGVAQTVLRVLGPAFRQVGIPIIRGFITILDGAISNVANLIQLFNALKNQNFARAGEISGDILEEGLETGTELVGQQRVQQVQQQAQQTIELIVEEDTDVVNSRIESGAENVIRRREDRTERIQDRGGF